VGGLVAAQLQLDRRQRWVPTDLVVDDLAVRIHRLVPREQHVRPVLLNGRYVPRLARHALSGVCDEILGRQEHPLRVLYPDVDRHVVFGRRLQVGKPVIGVVGPGLILPRVLSGFADRRHKLQTVLGGCGNPPVEQQARLVYPAFVHPHLQHLIHPRVLGAVLLVVAVFAVDAAVAERRQRVAAAPVAREIPLGTAGSRRTAGQVVVARHLVGTVGTVHVLVADGRQRHAAAVYLHLNWSLVQLTAFSQWTSSSPPLQSAIPSQTHDERMQPPVSHMYWLGPQVVAKGGTIVIDLGVGVVFEGHPISSLLSPQSSLHRTSTNTGCTSG
jgi:hypothetical protein